MQISQAYSKKTDNAGRYKTLGNLANIEANIDAKVKANIKSRSDDGNSKFIKLGDFDRHSVTVNKDGVIYDANNHDAKDLTNNSPETLVAILTQLALLNNGQNLKEGKNAFSTIKNPLILLKISDQLALQFNKFLENKEEKVTEKVLNKKVEKEKVTEDKSEKVSDTRLFWQLRGSIFSLMEALAVQAGKLEDKETQNVIIKHLKEIVEKETLRDIRDFACESIVGRMTKHELPGTNNSLKEIKELIYPTHPPTFKRLNIKRYVDDSGTEMSDHIKYLKSLRFNCKKTKDGDYIFNAKHMPGASKNMPVNIYIPDPDKESNPAIYECVGDKSTGLIDSWAHAGYGNRIDNALLSGKNLPGDGQVLAHYECWSAGKIGRIKNRFPGIQVIATTESTNDNLDEVCSKWLITGLLEGWKWEKIHKYMIQDLQKQFGKRADFKEFNLKNHYVFPHMRLNAKYIDRDNDGIKDNEDHLFNVTYPVKGDLAFGYEPVKQDVPDYALNGENLDKAVSNLKQIISYNAFLGKDPKVTWEPDRIECNGFFTPEKNEINTFRFHIDKENSSNKESNKLHVVLSKDFSHVSSSALSRMLSYEAGCFLGKESGLSGNGPVILGLAMLDRAIHQEESGSAHHYRDLGCKFIAPIFEEMFFHEKYGLSGVSFKDINAWLGVKGEDDGTKDNFKKLLENSREALKVNKSIKVPNKPNKLDNKKISITKIPVPEKINIPLSDIGYSTLLGEILPRLGINFKSIDYDYNDYEMTQGSKNKPGSIIISGKDEHNKVSTILLGFDREENLHSAGKLNFNIKEARDKITYNYLFSFANSVNENKTESKNENIKLDPDKLYSIYKENVDNGKPLSEALLAAFKWVRLLCPPGTICEDSYWFARAFQKFGLLLPGELELDTEKISMIFPKYYSGAEAEKELFNWVEKVCDITNNDKKKFEDIYLSKLAEGKSRSDAICAMLELFPDPKPKDMPSFPVCKIFYSLDLCGDPEIKNFVEILGKKAGVTHGDILVEEMVDRWFNNSSISNCVKNTCRRAAKSAIAEGKSAVEFIKAVVKAAYKENPSAILIRARVYLSDLRRLGLVSETEQKSLVKYLNREFNYDL